MRFLGFWIQLTEPERSSKPVANPGTVCPHATVGGEFVNGVLGNTDIG